MIKNITLSVIFISSLVYSHCQVPCGIYDDALRIHQIQEHIETITKAMFQIEVLSDQGDNALDANQQVRWINTKEEHATLIQRIVSDYFLTQRVKFKIENDSARTTYVQHTTTLHQMLVAAMKCKQSVDSHNADRLSELTKTFAELYFDEHGLEHLEELNHK